MDIARSNIRFLMHRDGIRSENELADRAKVQQSWLSRYLRGKIKKTNTEYVNKVAAVFGLGAADLMFRDLSHPGAVPPSQPAGLEAVIMQAAVKLEAFLQDLSSAPLPPETYSDRLYVASQVVRECGAEYILSGEKLVEGARSLAARLRVAGG